MKRRGASTSREIYFGFIQYVSCLYVLPVLHEQMKHAGYPEEPTVAVTALMSGIACIVSGLTANLPFILAPPTSVSIWFSVFLQDYDLEPSFGNQVSSHPLLIT